MARTSDTTPGKRRRTAARDTRPPVVLPADARAALAKAPEARAVYQGLSYTHRREYVEWITAAKRDEPRERRTRQMVEKLVSARPGRSNPPSTRPTVAKMGIKPGNRVLVLDADDAAMETWRELPGDARLERRKGRGGHDVVVLYAPTAAALARRLPAALAACGSAGVLWVAYLKQSSGRATTLTRDLGWEPTRRDDLKPVAMIAIDADWAAVKFRLLPTSR